ncbi:phytoene/squalene synthase family protein [Amnibacterium flavum]|uniref:phytoene/squalene synthase family protein n=1 Tax=Amnibacterium flavum TaxID=2173173 RepID=UPI0014038252|nr:phytoene/squalene synthase family protein [Amnibacterium flavum]
MSETAATRLYLTVAERASSVVIGRYSTSFGLASRLLGRTERRHVSNIYALVRVADEIVDGVAADLGIDRAETRERLDDYEAEVERALKTGYSTDLVVHAFATTARAVGFGDELTAPFFRSMRADLEVTEYTPETFEEYVYGSAEVVGLMCLAAFLSGRRVSPGKRAEFVRGARALGAAFQKVNFLRDLATDFGSLGRSYFPGVSVDAFDEATKNRLADDLDADLRVAAETIGSLPRGSRRAVAAAHGLFAELSARIRRTPAAELATTRVSVPNSIKIRLLISAALDRRRQ